MVPGTWQKEYTTSINYYFPNSSENETFYEKLYIEAERLYQLFHNNQTSSGTFTWIDGTVEGIDINKEDDLYNIELIFKCKITRATGDGNVQAIGNIYSFLFDGVDEYINITNDSSLAFGTNNFTISAWIKPTLGSGETLKEILYTRDEDNDYVGIDFHVDDGADRLRCIFDDGDEAIEFNGVSDAINSNWSHVMVTVNRSTGIAKFYINGSQSGSDKDISALESSFTSTHDYTIGSREHGNNYYQQFLGNIDEVAIWNNKELSSDEISAIYGTKMADLSVDAGGYESSAKLVGWWRFGDGVLDDRIKGGLVADQVNPTIGSELTTNGDVETWDNSTTLTGWTSEGGALRVSGARTSGSGTYYADFTDDSSGGDRFITPAFATVSGTVYKLTFWYKNTTSSTDVSIYASAFLLGYTTLTNTSGVWTQGVYYFAGNGNAALIRFRTGALDATISIDDVSVKQITGNAGIAINSEAADFEADVPA